MGQCIWENVPSPQGKGYCCVFFGASIGVLADRALRVQLREKLVEIVKKIDPNNAGRTWFQRQGFPSDLLKMPGWIKKELFDPASIGCSPVSEGGGQIVYCVISDPNDPSGFILVCKIECCVEDDEGNPISITLDAGGQPLVVPLMCEMAFME